MGGNISECGIGKLACYLDYVALDARDETVHRTTSLITVAGKRFSPDWGLFASSGDDKTEFVRITVEPLHEDDNETLYLVVFGELPAPVPEERPAKQRKGKGATATSIISSASCARRASGCNRWFTPNTPPSIPTILPVKPQHFGRALSDVRCSDARSTPSQVYPLASRSSDRGQP